MMRHELIRIVRVSYLLEYMTTEALGKCYVNNINTLFKMIELPYDQLDEYENKMAELTWIEPPKEGAPDLKKEATSAPPQAQLAAQQSVITADGKKDEKKKMQSILKVVFKLNDNKPVKEKIRNIDEDEPKNLLMFDLNYWDSNRIREY